MLRPEVQSLFKTRFSGFTEVQDKAIPLVLAGRNVLISAPTGYGKTEAAVLPVLSGLLDLRDRGLKDGIQAVYITPLKALNRDMLSRLEFWCRMLDLKLAVRHGDTSSSERVRQRESPPNFLITTPETLQSLLIAPKLRESLVNVRYVIVDEIHELAESKRGLQLALGLERLKLLKSGLLAELKGGWREAEGGRVKEKPLPAAEMQLLGLSATIGNQKEMAALLGNNCSIAKIDVSRAFEASVERPVRAASKEKLQGLSVSDETLARLLLVKQLVERHNRTLIFVNTRYMAEALGSLFSRVPGLKDTIAVHHSSLSRESRLEVEKEFKKPDSKLKAIVCTSSLELGIDIGEIDLVIQFGSPRRVSRFLQRVGRSGHRKHLTPKGEVIALDELDEVEAKVIVELARKGWLEPFSMRRNALDVLGHQLAGLAMDQDSVSVAEAFGLFRRAFPYAELKIQDLLLVLRQLSSTGIIAFEGERFARTRRTKWYYYENVSVIPDNKRYFVKDATTRKNVGVLDDSFVSEYLLEGTAFITRGRAWKVLSIDEKEIAVEPSGDFGAAIPDWSGEQIPVSREVANRVAAEFSSLGEFAEKQAAWFRPSAKKIFLEQKDDFLILHSFNGNSLNETLGRLLAILLTAKGTPVRVRAEAYSILVESPGGVSAARVDEALSRLRSGDVDRLLRAGLFDSSFFRHRFLHVATRFGVLRKDRDYRAVSLKRLAEAMRDSPVAAETFEELFYDRLDVVGCEDLLAGLRSGSLALETVRHEKWSPLAQNVLAFGGFGELFAPSEPAEKILEAFRKDLESKRLDLVCLYCGQTFSKSVIDEKVSCPFCSSSQVTLADYAPALKSKKGAKYLEGLKVASLISSYDSRALMALATYGVGPENAARILSRLHKTDKPFFVDLLEAQKTFIKNRKYWRV